MLHFLGVHLKKDNGPVKPQVSLLCLMVYIYIHFYVFYLLTMF